MANKIERNLSNTLSDIVPYLQYERTASTNIAALDHLLRIYSVIKRNHDLIRGPLPVPAEHANRLKAIEMKVKSTIADFVSMLDEDDKAELINTRNTNDDEDFSGLRTQALFIEEKEGTLNRFVDQIEQRQTREKQLTQLADE